MVALAAPKRETVRGHIIKTASSPGVEISFTRDEDCLDAVSNQLNQYSRNEHPTIVVAVSIADIDPSQIDFRPPARC